MPDYFDLFAAQDGLTEAELKAIVDDKAARIEGASYSAFQNVFSVKGGLVLLAGVVAVLGFVLSISWGELVEWQTQERFASFAPVERFTPIPDPVTTRIQHQQQDQVEKTFPRTVPVARGREAEFLPPYPPSCELSVWGYRMEPGKQLLYEITDENEYRVIVQQILVDVESRDDAGNLTVKVTPIPPGSLKPKEGKVASPLELQNMGAYRVTITPTGKVLSGEIVDPTTRENWERMVNNPEFRGGVLPVETRITEIDFRSWFPLLPEWSARTSGNTFVDSSFSVDTIEQFSPETFNDPSRHLDTVKGRVIYTSAKSRGIQPYPDDPEGKRARAELQIGLGLMVPNAEIAGVSRQESEKERQILLASLKPRENVQQIHRTYFARVQQNGRSSLEIALTGSETMYVRSDSTTGHRWRHETEVHQTFKSDDGTPLRVERSQDLWYKDQYVGRQITTIQLIHEESVETADKPPPPDIR
ncbi:MAG: hypothetical protein AB7H80_17495 [Candidatus Kapaibacterium sp.]